MTAQKFRSDGLPWDESDSLKAHPITHDRPSLSEFIGQIETIYGQKLKEQAREVAMDFWANWDGFLKLIKNNELELPIPLISPCDSERSRHRVPGEAATPSERSDAGVWCFA